MAILVTGGAGFIGSNIADRLISCGYETVIIDNLSTGKVKNINKKAIFYQRDICENLEDIFEKHKFEAVYHLAAQIDVRKSVSDPILDAQINIIGGINLLNAIVKYRSGKLIYSSTGGAIYGEPKYLPADEKHPVNPMAPYGTSKYCLEKYIEYFSKLYNLKYTILRYANVYGNRQDPMGEAGVIAIFMGKITQGKTPVIFGNGQQTRDFVFVKDVVEANLLSLNRGEGEIYNIGTGKETSVNEIYACLKELINPNEKAEYRPERPGEVFRIALDCSKAKRELQWEAATSLQDGIKETLKTY